LQNMYNTHCVDQIVTLSTIKTKNGPLKPIKTLFQCHERRRFHVDSMSVCCLGNANTSENDLPLISAFICSLNVLGGFAVQFHVFSVSYLGYSLFD